MLMARTADGKLVEVLVDDDGRLVVTGIAGGGGGGSIPTDYPTRARQDTGNTSLAQLVTNDGAAGTGIVPPTGGSGVLGFLSGILKALSSVLPVSWSGAPTVTVANASVPVSGSFWQATQPVSGTFWQATQPVSGPLTDVQLRATAVPVSGTFWQPTQPVSGPLTDVQLRATAVPVSGPLTDAQIRATAVGVQDKGGWASESVSGRTRDPLADMALSYGDGTTETFYFTTAGDYAGKSARA